MDPRLLHAGGRIDNHSKSTASDSSSGAVLFPSPGQSPLLHMHDEETVSSILKTKRKRRAIRACFPCRHRRVRCDGEAPCSSCVKRGHEELCRATESPGASGLSVGGGEGGGGAAVGVTAAGAAGMIGARIPAAADLHFDSGVSSSGRSLVLDGGGAAATAGYDDPLGVMQRLERIEEHIVGLKADLRRRMDGGGGDDGISINLNNNNNNNAAGAGGNANGTPGSEAAPPPPKPPGRHFVERNTGATIFLGSHADPPPALGLLSLSLFADPFARSPGGGSSSAADPAPRAYAFTNLWAPDVGITAVCNTLPADRDMVRYWQIYQASVYPYYPALVTFDAFSVALFSFLDYDRDRREKTDATWLALLFAVLACGAQFSDDAIEERDMRCKVFICSSFQCLRISNLFNNTDINTIQAMALIGHCLRNNLDTNTAWLIMGLTIRLAESIGLHEEPGTADSPGPAAERRRLWWILLWQDAFLSFTYDRPPSTTDSTVGIPYQTASEYSFADSTISVIKIILDRSREDANHLFGARRLEHYRGQLEAVVSNAAPFLQDKKNCKTLQEHLERLALNIHVGYVSCRMYRLYFEHNPLGSSAREPRMLAYSTQAVIVVRSFLDMHRLSANACRASAFIHNVVSSALALKSLMRDIPGADHIWNADFEACIQRLIEVLEKEQEKSEWTDADTNVRHFGPYSRALTALKGAFGPA